MKIIIYSVSLLFMALLSVQAQAQVKFGVQAHGSVNTAQLTSDTDSSVEKDWRLGYGAGIFAEIPLTTSLQLRPSLNFLTKGIKATEEFSLEGASISAESRMDINYLELPVLAIYNFGTTPGKWYVGAGPSFGYGLSGKAEVFQSTTIAGQTQTEFYDVKAFEDVDDDGLGFKRFDFSLNAVVGMRVLEKGFVQVGYLHSVTNIANKEDFSGNKYQNRSIMLTLGYRI